MLIAGHNSTSPTVLEVIDGNILQVTVVSALIFSPDNVGSDELFTRENIIGDPRIDRFIAPHLDVSHNSEFWYFRPKIVDSGQIELSASQINRIRRLTRNVTAREEQEFGTLSIHGRIPLVWMRINSRMYWSLYDPDIDAGTPYPLEYINRHLLLLAYELIELSPVPVGYASFHTDYGDVFSSLQ